MVPEMVLANTRATEIEREAERAEEGAVDDLDRDLRDDSTWGRGAWLVVLLGVLGIAALALLLHLLAGF
jgi:hypothetical protein